MRQYRISSLTWVLSVITLVIIQIGSLSRGYAQEPAVYILKASEWNVPRSSEAILAMPALRKTVQAYSKNSKAQIQIHYPGGDEGTLWATELRSWLVSMGIAAQHIELLPGSPDPGQLELQVVNPTVFDQPAK
jgi:hypothetical protein